MSYKFTNNGYATLAAGITSGDTTINLTAGQGARFPALAAGDYFYGTLIDTSNNLEIVKVTARSTDALTVIRGQDGTSSRAYSTGDRFELRWTKAAWQATMQEAVTLLAGSGTDTYTATLSPVPTAYNSGQVYPVTLPNANTTTTPTINLNSLGAKTIKKAGGVALSVGDIQANHPALLKYDGTDMILLNPAKGVMRGKQTVYIPAAAMMARTTNGALGPSQAELATNKINFKYFDFPDGATALYVQTPPISMPKSWDLGTVTARFHWTYYLGSGGNVAWQARGRAFRDGVSLDGTMGTAQKVTEATGASLNMHITADTPAITIAGTPAARDCVIFEFFRDPTDGSDTSTVTARLLGVEIIFNSNSADDS